MAFPTLLVFDGGIGTELYERGFYINRPFEELNLSSPDDVTAVHLSYIAAGAQVLTTNTFAASRPQLKEFDIDHELKKILAGALKCANAAIQKAKKLDLGSSSKEVQIALSIGPLGVLVEPLGSYGIDEAFEEFKFIASLALESGQPFQFYILETFTNLSELEAAIRGIRAVDQKTPIIASLSIKSSQKEVIENFARRIGDREDVQYLGINCSEGPTDLYMTLKTLAPLTTKPIIVQPNAGTPRHVNGRYFYMTSPDYMAKYAKRFIEAGARGVGGCCGTGPAHIEAIAGAVRMAQAQMAQGTQSKQVHASRPEQHAKVEPAQARTPLKSRTGSKVGKLLDQKKKVFSVELLPPKGTDVEKFFAGIDQLLGLGIEIVNIPDGARAMTRVNSLHLASLVQVRTKGRMHAIPHFTTRDRNLIALQSDLLGASVNGIGDLLIVTGDPPKLGNNREATAVYDIDSIGLTYLADCLNRGVTPNGESLGQGTSFGIGVASNPTAVNLEQEEKRFGFKVESGADFAVTQPIFDSEKFLKWRESLESKKQYIPHLIGIWPLLSLRNAEFMANEVPGVSIPAWILSEMEKASHSKNPKEDSIKRGIDIAERVMRELDSACEGFCISAPLGRVDVVASLLSRFDSQTKERS